MLTTNIGSNLAAKFGAMRSYKVGSQKIWRGATVVLRSDGLAYPATEDVSDTYKQIVIGWALEVGDIGATSLRVRSDGLLARKFPGVDQNDIGKLALIKDDETVHTYAEETGKIVCGRITSIHVEGLECFVDFTDKPLRVANSLYL